jgi:DNA mismatch endonuclease, patch repair protein
MSKIRGKNTKPEIQFRKALWHAGLRFRINDKKLPGKPDIVNKKLKLVVFIDGEFWHGKDWKYKKSTIKSNRAFWIPKIERNIQRDGDNTAQLQKLGFTVFRFWQEDVERNLGVCLMKVLNHAQSRLDVIDG